MTTTDASTYTCRYCRLPSDASGTACPHCGAPVDVTAVVSTSGWQEQPPIRDMARIQFGQSTCQIEGTYVPDRRLQAGRRRLDLLLPPPRAVDRADRADAPHVDGRRVEPDAGGPAAGDARGPGPGAHRPLRRRAGRGGRHSRFSTGRASGCGSTGSWPPPATSPTPGSNRGSGSSPAAATTARRTTRSACTSTYFQAQAGPGLLLLHSPGNTFIRDLAPARPSASSPAPCSTRTRASACNCTSSTRNSAGLSFQRPLQLPAGVAAPVGAGPGGRPVGVRTARGQQPDHQPFAGHHHGVVGCSVA